MKTIIEFLNELNTDLDLAYVYEDSISFDEFSERIDQMINETDVVYYSVAMDYLQENDNSLNESISIAVELGYSLENVNSELLATLLKQQNLREQFSELSDEIEVYFDEYDEFLTINA